MCVGTGIIHRSSRSLNSRQKKEAMAYRNSQKVGVFDIYEKEA